jgi:uncharacterized protein YbjQ (UPF0145 family)
MNIVNCTSCGKSKAQLTCGICEESICKKCTQFVEESAFSFLKWIPADLSHNAYCPTCHIQKVMPELEKYNDTMEQAKNTAVFMRAQNKEVHRIKRLEEPLEINECEDRNELILRLAFFAAQMGYNSIIDVNVVAKKVRSGSYQTTVYSGTAIPVHVDQAKLIKDKSSWSSPN